MYVFASSTLHNVLFKNVQNVECILFQVWNKIDSFETFHQEGLNWLRSDGTILKIASVSCFDLETKFSKCTHFVWRL